MSETTPLLFFLHIPKTAGTTLNSILESEIPAERILSVYDRNQLREMERIEPDKLARLRLVQGHILVNDFEALFSLPRPVQVFTFLRHPVDRIISEYQFLKTWPEQHLFDLLNQEEIDLEEYVASERKELAFRGKNLMTRLLSGLSFPLDSVPPEVLGAAKNNLFQRMAMFGLVERFDESLLMLKDLAGLENVYYEQRNVRRAPLKRTDLPERTLALIEEFNRADIELYDEAARVFGQRAAGLGPSFERKLAEFRFLNAKFQKISDLLMREHKGKHEGIKGEK